MKIGFGGRAVKPAAGQDGKGGGLDFGIGGYAMKLAEKPPPKKVVVPYPERRLSDPTANRATSAGKYPVRKLSLPSVPHTPPINNFSKTMPLPKRPEVPKLPQSAKKKALQRSKSAKLEKPTTPAKKPSVPTVQRAASASGVSSAGILHNLSPRAAIPKKPALPSDFRSTFTNVRSGSSETLDTKRDGAETTRSMTSTARRLSSDSKSPRRKYDKQKVVLTNPHSPKNRAIERAMLRFQTAGYWVHPESKKKVQLQNREFVAYLLEDLHTNVSTPIMRHLGVSYQSFKERHPQDPKRGMTNSIPLFKEVRSDKNEDFKPKKVRCGTHYHISIKIRKSGDNNNFEEFYNRGSLLALLFHELSHMKAMNHGENFLKTLKGIYEFATDKGLFKPEAVKDKEENWICECESPWGWEREIFRTGGKADLEMLLKIHREEETLRQKMKKEREAEAAKLNEQSEKDKSKPGELDTDCAIEVSKSQPASPSISPTQSPGATPSFCSPVTSTRASDMKIGGHFFVTGKDSCECCLEEPVSATNLVLDNVDKNVASMNSLTTVTSPISPKANLPILKKSSSSTEPISPVIPPSKTESRKVALEVDVDRLDIEGRGDQPPQQPSSARKYMKNDSEKGFLPAVDQSERSNAHSINTHTDIEKVVKEEAKKTPMKDFFNKVSSTTHWFWPKSNNNSNNNSATGTKAQSNPASPTSARSPTGSNLGRTKRIYGLEGAGVHTPKMQSKTGVVSKSKSVDKLPSPYPARSAQSCSPKARDAKGNLLSLLTSAKRSGVK